MLRTKSLQNDAGEHRRKLSYLSQQLRGLFRHKPIDDKKEMDAAKQLCKEQILESYRALDILAAAVFQVGIAAFVGGVAIGLTIVPHYSELVVIGSFLPLATGMIAGLAMIEIDNQPPDIIKLEAKQKSVYRAALLLIVSIGIIVSLLVLLLSLTG